MTANLFGDAFLGRKPAWHGLGTVIDPANPLTVLEAMDLAKMLYEIRTTKVVTEAFGKRIDTGKVALVRQPHDADPEPRIFGFVTPKYQVVDNRAIAGLLQPIADSTGWRVETVGALGRGERIFATLQAGEVQVPGDTSPTTIFYFVSAGHDGGSALTIGCTPIRIVCQNTLMMGLSAATIRANVSHAGDALGSAEFTFKTVAQMQQSAEAVTEALTLLAAKPATAPALASIFDAAYDQPVDTRSSAQARAFLDATVTLAEADKLRLEGKVSKRENWLESVKLYKTNALTRFEAFNDENPAVANTPYGVFQAICETEQYRRGKGAETILKDVMFGGFRGQTMARAFDAALAIALAAN